MAKAYLIAHIRVHDTNAYEKFKAMSGPAIAQHKGKYSCVTLHPTIVKES